MKATVVQAAIVCAALGIASPGRTADITPLVPEAKAIESPSGWTFTVAPYF